MENSTVLKYKLKDLDRKVLVDKFHLTQLNRDVQIVVAKEEDKDLITEYMLDEFLNREPMNTSMDLRREQFAGYMEATLNTSMKQDITILAVDNGFLCGMFLNNVHPIEHDGKWKEPVMKSDYGEDFDITEAIDEKHKKIKVMLKVTNSYVAQNLPADAKEYVFLDCLSVHRDYVKNGLATLLVVESMRWVLQSGYKYAQITGSSVATNVIATKMGFTKAFTLDLKKFKNHGKPVFVEQFYDGGKEISTYVCEIEKILPKQSLYI